MRWRRCNVNSMVYAEDAYVGEVLSVSILLLFTRARMFTAV